MKADRPQLARARGGVLAAIALLALVAACDAPLPTSAEIDNMDVASAEKWATRVKMIESTNDSVVYTIDGRHADADQAHALDAAQIAMIMGNRHALALDSGTASYYEDIQITTQKAAAAMGNGARMMTPSRNTGADIRIRSSRADTAFTGLFVIDGKLADAAAMQKLSPQAIKSIEVIKGAAATKLYSDPRAANGVIKISTHNNPTAK